MHGNGSQIYEFADFRLDVSERRLLRSGTTLPLTEKVFETLCVLVRRGGNLVTKDELIEQVWPNAIVEENNLDKSISRLRKLLGEEKGTREFIETVRGHGYRFVAPVNRLGAGSAEVKAGGDSEVSRPNGIQASIAVLPFANMSADPENEYFGDGLAEELLNALAKIKDLKVAARTSSFSFKNKNIEVSEIGTALNVNTILEGSVRKAGDRLRIVVQLINASDGYHMWSERYEGELKDVFDLQDRITMSVINELKVRFVSEEIDSVRDRYAENVEAYQLYLKGRYHFLKLTPPETWKGISYFEQAIAIEPNYALAYAGLAAAYVTFPMTSDGPPKEFFPKAKAAAEKAIEIDNRLSETYAALFWVNQWFDWDWDECERTCLRSIELNPKSADGYEAYAHLLSNIGRHDESIEMIERARSLDPLHLRINALEGQFLVHAGRIDEALERLKKVLELEPRFWLTHIFSSSAYTAKGMYAEAIESAQKARDFSGSTHPIAFLGFALAKSGRDAEARALLDELFKMSAEQYIPQPHIAMIYNGLGDTEKALEWLELGYNERDCRMAFLKVEPKWNNLRSEPRFIELMKKMNFSG